MADKDVFKSLGIKRRSGGESESPSTDDEEEAKTKKPKPSSGRSSGPRLGIKRRSGKAVEEAKEADGDPEGDADDADDAEDSEATAEATADGAALTPSGRPSLGEDDTAVLLSSFFKVRPQIREQIPPQTFGLHRTHGRYIGDGRPERALRIGWRPGLVLYTVPPYMEGEMPTVDRDGNLTDAPLHEQPAFIDGGFVVNEKFNRAGDWYVYVVFKSDEPVEILPPPGQEKKRRGRGGPKKGGGSGDVRSGLGIKRRS